MPASPTSDEEVAVVLPRSLPTLNLTFPSLRTIKWAETRKTLGGTGVGANDPLKTKTCTELARKHRSVKRAEFVFQKTRAALEQHEPRSTFTALCQEAGALQQDIEHWKQAEQTVRTLQSGQVLDAGVISEAISTLEGAGYTEDHQELKDARRRLKVANVHASSFDEKSPLRLVPLDTGPFRLPPPAPPEPAPVTPKSPHSCLRSTNKVGAQRRIKKWLCHVLLSLFSQLLSEFRYVNLWLLR
jgi:hypothetical protein